MAMTVLSLDDSASIRQMLKLTLTGAGYTDVQANDGTKGVAKARAATVHLVVTDPILPVIVGLDLIRELRKLPAFKGVPTIFLTTASDAAKKQDAKTAGATGWITKPFQQDQLVAAIRRVLGA